MTHPASKGQPLRGLIAYGIASFAAGLSTFVMFNVDGFVRAFRDPAPVSTELDTIMVLVLVWTAITMVLNFSAIIGGLAALPGALAVLAMRKLRLPRGWTDTFLGACVGAAIPALFMFALGDGNDVFRYSVFSIPGAIGGLVYWLAAGRPTPTQKVSP
ncbi:hypothetical protein L5876_11010 [Hyphobacterium sp. SN044]|uniref:hypothetical protein n=1 Tax=Hyphobacterium sp. SN044 TaxID=2912575 RepID=UPI001F1A43B9|nr:hypothetical protein [Hyphobacterium sp. SN044]MCF8880345.1 hypothetical protein [Hyphobacterium sp. SN044]